MLGPAQREAICKRAIQIARDEHEEEGTLEIDDNPTVSANFDEGVPYGAYVAAWVWVDLHDEFCRTCSAPYSGYGDGFDGECPECADKTEEKRLKGEIECES